MHVEMSPASTPDSIEILVNGEPEQLPAGSTVVRLLDDLGLGDKRVAVAVERDVVPRSAWAETTLAAGARVEILEAVGGG